MSDKPLTEQECAAVLPPNWIERPFGFLSEDRIAHNSEPFQYIAELHRWLWAFAEAATGAPASGNVKDAAASALATIADLRAKLAAVTEDRDAWWASNADRDQELAVMTHRAEAAEAEARALREALEGIATMDTHRQLPKGADAFMDGVHQGHENCAILARRALRGKEADRG